MATPLDFASILATDKKLEPASVTQINKNEVKRNINPNTKSGKDDKKSAKKKMQLQLQLQEKINKQYEYESLLGTPDVIMSMDTDADQRQARKASELAYRLSLRTSLLKNAEAAAIESSLLPGDEEKKRDDEDENLTQFMDTHSLAERMRLEKLRRNNEESLPCELHQVQLGDWESKINWEGVTEDTNADDTNGTISKSTSTDGIGIGNTSNNNNSGIPVVSSSTSTISNSNGNGNGNGASKSQLPDPTAILSETYNLALEAIDLDNLINWDGADASPDFSQNLARKLGKLILQDGVAGLSIASKSIATANSKPAPFNQSESYKRRMELRQSGDRNSGAVVGSLQKNHAALEKEIKARQEKRARMAIDKTSRVKDALGKLDLGGGTGRAITSSLMGPGGTERTGRPSRQNLASQTHDAAYVEQLDMVNNHILVPADKSFAELRHYHRPLLPRKLFKPGKIMPWQFQVRVTPNTNLLSKRKKVGADGSLMSSYQNTMPGSSQNKIRNGADLTPSEGKLVVFEYSEENPPLQMTKGMASKIINFYRGDRAHVPVSAGGGDRPLRKKKHGHQDEDRSANSSWNTGKIEKPPKLSLNSNDKVMDLIGKIPSRKKNDDAHNTKEPKVTVLPEGSTEILHAKDHGPFIGAIRDGVTQSGLISSIFAAPLFRHEPKKTDFLLILVGKLTNKTTKVPVVIRPMPDSIFCVGQAEPKTKVHPPESSGERQFFGPFSVFQIAKALSQKEDGLKFEDIKEGLFPNTGVLANQLRQRIKKVAIYDKNTQIWTLKKIGFEDFPGLDALGREVSHEGVAANWEARAATLRLQDLGINFIYRTANGTTNLAAAITYLNGQIHAAKKRLRMLSKIAKSKDKTKQTEAYAKLSETKLEAAYKLLKRKGEVANFIFEELQLAPWQLTADFIDVHKKGQGSGMMKLTGLGDPSGIGNAFNFIREVDGKANKSSPNGDGALKATVKKITGTDNDLRKLNMTQMASILQSYGLKKKDIDKLKRWDRVHCIRDLSTKAASDNMSDGLEKFARGEKMKLSDQKKIYSERIQEIWERQRQALSEEPGDLDSGRGVGGFDRTDEELMDDTGGKKDEKLRTIKDDDSDDTEDDAFFDDLENTFEDTKKTNELVSDELRNGEGESGAFRSLKKDGNSQELNRDAMELAQLQRQREEERANKKDMDAVLGEEAHYKESLVAKQPKKVIRRKVTKTNPDGTQTITFKFILQASEIRKTLSEKKDGAPDLKPKKKKKSKSQIIHEGSKYPVGHAMFEEEDEGGRVHMQIKRRGRGARGRKAIDEEYTVSKSRKTPVAAKSRSRSSTDKRSKRKRSEDEDADFYVTNARRKGTSNRKERGAARERMPHVMFSQRLEEIRLLCEKRPGSGPFHRPVNKKNCNVYYEKIKRPIDLQTIRDKISKYEYRTVHAFLLDFELMKNNARTFNGDGHPLSNEGNAIYEFTKAAVEESRDEFDQLETLVDEQMNSKRGRTSRASTPKLLPSKIVAGKTAKVTIHGITTEVNLGNIESSFLGNETDSDDGD